MLHLSKEKKTEVDHLLMSWRSAATGVSLVDTTDVDSRATISTRHSSFKHRQEAIGAFRCDLYYDI